VVNADGTGRIILAPADMFVGGLAWSPDGARIAYTGVVDGQEHVLVANADGSGRTDVTPGMESSHPTWTGR
jgi:Tol biopolymer transport system component